MLNVNNAIREFWGSFGLPVFHSNFADGNFPYITYELGFVDLWEEYNLTGRLWVADREHPVKVSTGFPAIYWETLDKIEKAVNTSVGMTIGIKDGGGRIWIRRGTPFIIHNVPNDIRSVKSALININVKYYTP